MHASSFDSMQRCAETHLKGDFFASRPRMIVADIGAGDYNGGYRPIFDHPRIDYLGVDIAAHAGVSVVMDSAGHIPLETESADVVISGQMLEHAARFWETFREMARVVRPGGYIFLIAPSSGPIHRYPVDCYRFYPDSFEALADLCELKVVELRHDSLGPWNDLVGVFTKPGLDPAAAGHVPSDGEPKWRCGRPRIPAESEWSTDETENLTRGMEDYLPVLVRLHDHLTPRGYLEVGVRHGRSLQLARCPAVGVDPEPEITVDLPESASVVRETSDDFFAHSGDLEFPVDMAFIDGMHLFEYALRDFINIERLSNSRTIVVVDDVLPNHPAQADRSRRTRVWSGDIWRLHRILRTYRPDLQLDLLDTSPTGLLVIRGLDPVNDTLPRQYNPIVREARTWEEVPQEVLERTGAIDPRTHALAGPSSVRVGHSSPPDKPDVSIVVVGYDMQRELPRTIETLSRGMQRDVDSLRYEVIVVDNGSAEPIHEAWFGDSELDLRVVRIDRASVSPAHAVNRGIAASRSDLVGVAVDGARMVSPGVVAGAVTASRLHGRPVIVTLAFHLGPKVQMESIRDGYEKTTEDALLAGSGWENDGYRLFSVACLAGSSRGGWLRTPTESNLLFMPRDLWSEIGGFDEQFQSPGGGLVNLDTFRRACDLPDSQLITLLGEGTFHQIHGGVATNAMDSPFERFAQEYAAIRGVQYSPPEREAIFVGSNLAGSAPHMIDSLRRAMTS